MKTSVHLFEDCTKIFMESETAPETVTLMKAAARVKKPVQTFGRLREDGTAWCWIILPCKKKADDVLRFGNE